MIEEKIKLYKIKSYMCDKKILKSILLFYLREITILYSII